MLRFIIKTAHKNGKMLHFQFGFCDTVFTQMRFIASSTVDRFLHLCAEFVTLALRVSIVNVVYCWTMFTDKLASPTIAQLSKHRNQCSSSCWRASLFDCATYLLSACVCLWCVTKVLEFHLLYVTDLRKDFELISTWADDLFVTRDSRFQWPTHSKANQFSLNLHIR